MIGASALSYCLGSFVEFSSMELFILLLQIYMNDQPQFATLILSVVAQAALIRWITFAAAYRFWATFIIQLPDITYTSLAKSFNQTLIHHSDWYK